MEIEQHETKPKKKYKCSHDGCTAEFDRPYRLSQHQLTHLNLKHKRFTCVEEGCDKAYTWKSHLERHVNNVHRSYNSDVVYSCPKCLKQYANSQNLKRHYKTQHCTKEYSCEQCPLSFKLKHQLSTHMYHHTGKKAFRCPMCPKEFVTKSEQKKHLRNHKVFTCENCNQQFTRWMDITQHKKSSHKSEEYICNDCGKVFNQRQHIVRHVKLHVDSEISIFFCPFENCFRRYSRNSNLNQHVRVKHQGRTFDCHLCDVKLTSKARLNLHIERHNRPAVNKPPKTLVTGRKKRKDACIPRTNTALKLAGLHCSVEQNQYEAENGISEHGMNNADINQLYSLGL